MSSAAIGVCVVVACTVVFKDRILEQWYLYKLQSGGVEEQKVAAERLSELEAVRAVPALLRSCKTDPVVAWLVRGDWDDRANKKIAVWCDDRGFAQDGLPWETRDDPSRKALHRIIASRRRDSLPYLDEAIREGASDVRRRAAMTLIQLGPDAAPAIPALEAALGEAPDEVIEYVLDELKNAIGVEPGKRNDTGQAEAVVLETMQGHEKTER